MVLLLIIRGRGRKKKLEAVCTLGLTHSGTLNPSCLFFFVFVVVVFFLLPHDSLDSERAPLASRA